MGKDIDRDIGNIPAEKIVSTGYARLFEAHIAGGIEMLAYAFRHNRMKRALTGALVADFDARYRRLLTDTRLTFILEEHPMDGPPGGFKPRVLFATNRRGLVIPDSLLASTPGEATEDQSGWAVVAFARALVKMMVDLVIEHRLPEHVSEEICDLTAFSIGVQFDSETMRVRADDRSAVAPVLAFVDDDGALRLMSPDGAIHEYAGGSADMLEMRRAAK